MKEITYEEFRGLSLEEQGNFTGIIKYHGGSRCYYYNDMWHRIDGPAIIEPDGDVEYWIHGTKTTKEGQELYHSLMRLKGLI